MDRFRIQALEKILGRSDLRESYRQAAEAMLAEKREIFARGARKRATERTLS
jgi:hypothetical protein